MTSQLNNLNENQDQMLQEPDTLRPVFFELTSNRGSASVLSSSEKTKRVRLDASVITSEDHHHRHQIRNHSQEVPSDDKTSAGPHDPLPPSLTPLNISHHHRHNHQHRHSHSLIHHRHMLLQHHILSGNSVTVGAPETSVSKFSASSVDSESSLATSPSSLHAVPLAPKEPLFGRKNSAARPSHIGKKSPRVPAVSSALAANYGRAPKLFCRLRSRSLPTINYTSRAHFLQPQVFPTRHLKSANPDAILACVPTLNLTNKSSTGLSSLHHKSIRPSRNLPALASAAAPAIPPITLQSFKEIDLQEILKNPQLRHDILFDPQLQFRPNLDGDRGRRKKSVIQRYWAEIEKECKQFFDASFSFGTQPAKIHRLPALFTTLRDILLSLLPAKDRAPVNEIMDMELVVQQFSHGSFDFVAMAHWLGEVFKSHCAPMRDQWVSEMISKFEEASVKNSVAKLVQGLRSIFSILEAMKLDVANHQIRILRPVLTETAVDFERDYFNQLIIHNKVDISDSLKWFYASYQKKVETNEPISDFKSVLSSSIIDLLSCLNMATEFPSTLAFDHTRLVLLRADVRQLVCVQLCVVLFKQLILNYELAAGYRAVSLRLDNVTKIQEEILAIVTDEHGNVKWTRNIRSVAIQLVKNVVNDPASALVNTTKLPQPMIDFSYNWLLKQILPTSDVYGLMEGRVFKDLSSEVEQNTCEGSASRMNVDFKVGNNKLGRRNKKADSEMTGISNRISTLMKFHWNVFGDYYLEYIQKQTQY